MDPTQPVISVHLSPTKLNRRLHRSSDPTPHSKPRISLMPIIDFDYYQPPPSNNNNEFPCSLWKRSAINNPEDSVFIPATFQPQIFQHQMLLDEQGSALLETSSLKDGRLPPYDKFKPRYHSDSKISYYYKDYNSNIMPAAQPVDGKNPSKCKQIDGATMDFKLQVLHWAYSKTIHSAGHHFNLERCVVRNWMMNEDKIYNSASEKGKRKWRNFDSRLMRHLDCTRPVPGRIAESRLINGLGELTF